ncbi:kinase-like domain-containing protein [Mycena epipterygia]|nr:kinase-like domain-containing protein [Mycena epipterygia]
MLCARAPNGIAVLLQPACSMAAPVAPHAQLITTSQILETPAALYGPGSEALSLMTKIYMYKDCLTFLVDIDRNLSSIDYVPCTTSTDSVLGLAHSVESRKLLLKLASELGVIDNGKFQNALYNDAQHIVEHVVAVIQSPEATKAALKLEGESAMQFLDVVKNTLHGDILIIPEYRSRAGILIHKIYEAWDKFPSNIFIHGVTDRDRYPSFGGGYADIYRARYRSQPVALKRLRIFIQGEEPRAIRSKFRREVLVWQRLDHPYILPLIGIYCEESSWFSLFMVSPWMDRGNILGHLKDIGRDDVNRLLHEIAEGLQYLHSQGVVHGDLRGQNVVITENWNACLIDFGLSRYSEASRRPSKDGGSTRWMAPELIEPELFGLEFLATYASDVYAFGCVCLELYTGRPPFSKISLSSEYAVIQQVVDGNRPERPTEDPLMSNKLWQSVTTYWEQDPSSRPSVNVVVRDMEEVAAESCPSDGFGPPDLSFYGGLIPSPLESDHVQVSSQMAMMTTLFMQQGLACKAENDDRGICGPASARRTSPECTPLAVCVQMLPASDEAGALHMPFKTTGQYDSSCPLFSATMDPVVDIP